MGILSRKMAMVSNRRDSPKKATDIMKINYQIHNKDDPAK